jgi:hypothetical protein
LIRVITPFDSRYNAIKGVTTPFDSHFNAFIRVKTPLHFYFFIIFFTLLGFRTKQITSQKLAAKPEVVCSTFI